MHPIPSDKPVSLQPSRCPYERAATSGISRLCTTPVAGDLSTPAIETSQLKQGEIILIGVNHHTAAIELRERFYQGGELSDMLEDLRRAGLAEAVVLFTCNRFEVYGAVGAGGIDTVIHYLASRCGMPKHELLPSLYQATGQDAALHLMRVAAGLESLVLGEPQILGQVSDALAYAQANDAIGAILTRLFTSAIHAGKRARTETGIGRHTLSISHAAVLLLRSACDLTTARVLVVGAGEMAALAVGALQAHGATHIRIANRTHGRGEALASKFHVVAEQWDDLPALTNDSDAVIVATSSPTPVIHAADIGSRVDRLQLVDLSVPRNIEEGCRNIAGVTLHDVDGLQQVVESHRIQRQREASRVEELLEQELAEYLDWVHSRAVTPLIADLRRQANAIVEAEVDLTLRRLPQLDAQAQAVVAQMAHRIVGKLLHSPTVALKSRDSAAQFAQAVRQLFGLAACDEETGHRAGQPVRGGRDA